jgi:hypothetical protein
VSKTILENTFCIISFYISHLYLYNTRCIIFIDNCGWLNYTYSIWFFCMWSIILRNQAHSRKASYNIIIFEWLVNVAINVCLHDFQEIIVPPCKNTYPICDLTFQESDKYLASAYPINLDSLFFWNNNPRSIVPTKYHKIFLMSFQWHIVGAALCLTRQFTAKAMLDLVLFTRHISAPMALRYGYSGPNTSSPSSFVLNGSLSFSKARTTIGVLAK